ncbi:5-aminolevulic acid synthase [Parasulfitobacter algicola]|uniref:5-aminolevulic acid synthase n=1 Tax=Parasulfitobacter algicola TaxID=2614809 RepID=A0ABX2ISA1_9RHOB|nr:5-aminolevulic acid synthase [Sulfitobacter algicola]NSX55771.1 5-aminolevulic acid synthase [Sulfitobacter algicola]
MRFLLTAILVFAGAAQADTIDGKTARDLLFHPKRTEVVMFRHDFLSDQDIQMLQQVALQQPYYTSVAVSPDDGVLSNATLAAANYHDVSAADTAALAACNAARDGRKPCVIVAHIRPKGWDARDLQLSGNATEDFRKSYLRARGTKALAVSPSTGQWSVIKGDNAQILAKETCDDKAKTSDCVVVLSE